MDILGSRNSAENSLEVSSFSENYIKSIFDFL